MHRGRASSWFFRRVRIAALVVAALAAPPRGAVLAGDEPTPPPVAPAGPAAVPAVAPPAIPAPAGEAQAPPPAPVDEVHAAPQLEFAPFNDKVFIEARKSGAPVGLYFEADWCHPCREMHARTFREPAVLEAAAGYRLFRVDMTRPGAYLEILEKSFRVVGAPTVILFGPDGKERTRRFGFIPPDEFARMLGEGRKPSPSS